MKVTEKQLIVMLRALEGSLHIADATGLNLFGYDSKVREKVYNDIVNQSNKLIEIDVVETF